LTVLQTALKLENKVIYWTERRKTTVNYANYLKLKHAKSEQVYKKKMKLLEKQIESYNKRINSLQEANLRILSSLKR
jgi:hypothetical protein